MKPSTIEPHHHHCDEFNSIQMPIIRHQANARERHRTHRLVLYIICLGTEKIYFKNLFVNSKLKCEQCIFNVTTIDSNGAENTEIIQN